MTAMKGTCWPRLTATLTGPRDREHCQSCGAAGSLDPATDDRGLVCAPWPSLTAWQEHDGNDQPTCAAVVLCRECSDRLIDKHPRLYRAVRYWEPFPGLMALCGDCRHRNGVHCDSPRRTGNGGPGFAVIHPEPSMVHVYRRGKGARSGWEAVYVGPPTDCEGKEALP